MGEQAAQTETGVDTGQQGGKYVYCIIRADQPLVFLAILSPARELDAAETIDVSAEEPWRSLKAAAP
jgi:hypothetical protein